MAEVHTGGTAIQRCACACMLLSFTLRYVPSATADKPDLHAVQTSGTVDQ